jgi:hypothetical protein
LSRRFPRHALASSRSTTRAGPSRRFIGRAATIASPQKRATISWPVSIRNCRSGPKRNPLRLTDRLEALVHRACGCVGRNTGGSQHMSVFLSSRETSLQGTLRCFSSRVCGSGCGLRVTRACQRGGLYQFGQAPVEQLSADLSRSALAGARTPRAAPAARGAGGFRGCGGAAVAFIYLLPTP